MVKYLRDLVYDVVYMMHENEAKRWRAASPWRFRYTNRANYLKYINGRDFDGKVRKG